MTFLRSGRDGNVAPGARHPSEEVSKPDSVPPPNRREQQPFNWSPGYPGDRATDPRERAGNPRPAEAGPPSYTVLLRMGFAEPRPHERGWRALTLAVSPLPPASRPGAVFFLWHFPPIARRRR